MNHQNTEIDFKELELNIKVFCVNLVELPRIVIKDMIAHMKNNLARNVPSFGPLSNPNLEFYLIGLKYKLGLATN